MSTIKASGSCEIDLLDPMVAGGQIVDALAVPVLKQVAAESLADEEGRMRLWCGALASLLAVMTHQIGPDAAEEIFHGFDDAFDEVRGIRARGAH